MKPDSLTLAEAVRVLKEEGYTVTPPPEPESEPCFFCDAPAFHLCDGVLAWLKRDIFDFAPRSVIDTRKPEEAAFRCDRPLCLSCIAERGMKFFCGKRSSADSEDLCRDCASIRAVGGSRPLVTREEGEALKRRRLFRKGVKI